LEFLRNRIEGDLTRLAPPLEGIGFEYGFNSNYLREIGQHWLNNFDWRKEEKRLNSMTHFKTSIEGLDVHYIHVKPKPENVKGKTILPLLMVHGWPGKLVLFSIISDLKNITVIKL